MRNIHLVLVVLLFSLSAFGQADSSQVDNVIFYEMIIVNDSVYTVNNHGKVKIWDINKLSLVYEMKDTIPWFTSVSSDKKNNVYFGTSDGRVYKYLKNEKKFDLELKLRKKKYIIDFVFNSKNELFLILPNGIYDPKARRLWNRFNLVNSQVKYRKRYLHFFHKKVSKAFVCPNSVYIDRNDIIWTTRSYGEWGGSLQRFDSRNRKIINTPIDSLNFNRLNPNSVFEDYDGNVYLTSGIEHLMNWGDIFMIRGTQVNHIYNGDAPENSKKYEDVEVNGELMRLCHDIRIYIGPGAYNRFDNKIYYYTNLGFFKSSIPENGCIRDQELVLCPELILSYAVGAVGMDIPIVNVEFSSKGMLVFLSSKNGVGVYDGVNLVMLK